LSAPYRTTSAGSLAIPDRRRKCSTPTYAASSTVPRSATSPPSCRTAYPFQPVIIRGRVTEWLEGDHAWEIIDQIATKYTGQPYTRDKERIVAVVEPDQQLSARQWRAVRPARFLPAGGAELGSFSRVFARSQIETGSISMEQAQKTETPP
jgi:hypothetical protein